MSVCPLLPFVQILEVTAVLKTGTDEVVGSAVGGTDGRPVYGAMDGMSSNGWNVLSQLLHC
jgi:hypothetical protein